MKQLISKELGIKIAILAFFLVGLENIQLPPLDIHEWRQTLTLSIAHNFLENPNIFFPRMDIGGNTEGIIACEFPVFNYLLAGIFKLFGTHDWFGRLLNWTVSCIGLWFFFDVVRKSTNFNTAFYALIALMSSIIFEYARKSMPDTFALFVTITGVWFLWNYLQNQSKKYLVVGAVLVTLGILSKIPFVLLLIFLLLPFLDEQYPRTAKRNLVIAIGLGLIGVVWWYFYWMPYLLEHFKNQLIWPVSLIEGYDIVTRKMANDSWRMTLDIPFHHKIPCLVAIMGLGVIWTGANHKLKIVALLYIAVFFLFTLKTGIVFPTHEYYVIPLVPLLALCAGCFLDQLKLKAFVTIPIAIVLFYTGFKENRQRSFNPVSNNRSYMMGLTEVMQKYTQPADKIMVNNGPFNPFMMYWAQRKGWTVNPDVTTKQEWMEDFKKQGLKYIVLDRHISDDSLPYPILYEDTHFKLYKP